MLKQRLEIEISGNDSKFGAVADRTMLRLNKIGGAVSKMAGLFGVGLGASAAINAANQLARYGAELESLSRRMGVSVEVFQKLEYAAKGYGGTLNDVASVMQRIAEIKVDAVRGGPNSEMAVMLDRLGVKFEDLQYMRVDQIFYKIAEAIRTAKTEQALLGEATKALGGAVASLLPAMRQGVVQLGEEFEKLGGIIDEQTTKKLNDAQSRLDRWWMRAKGVAANEIVGAVDIVSETKRNATTSGGAILDFIKDVTGMGPGKGMYDSRAKTIPEAWRLFKARWEGVRISGYEASGRMLGSKSPNDWSFYGPANYDWQGPPAPEGYGTTASDSVAKIVQQLMPATSSTSDALARIGLFRGGGQSMIHIERRKVSLLEQIASSTNKTAAALIEEA